MSGDEAVSNRVEVLTGHGIDVRVERGQLQVSDGVGRQRRKLLLNRATCGLKRLVVIGHSGAVTLEAMRRLWDIGAAFVHLDYDGTVLVANGPSGLNDARLRRAQALAESNGLGLAIARDLIESKLSGQAEVLTRIPDSQHFIAWIEQTRVALGTAETPKALRLSESQAASAYWSAWSTVGIQFARKGADKIPAHWSIFLTRSSPISNATRAASTPINALLNYCYAILETEVRLGIPTLGLDPGMGMLHSDQKSRDSFVYDVIEPLRPRVDGYLLDILQERTFRAADFFETRQGVCRLMPSLTQSLAELSPQLARLVGPVVEQVAQRVVHGQSRTSKPITVPTLLSQSNRSDGRDRVRTNVKREAEPTAQRLPNACQECGTILATRRRKYCDACLPAVRDRSIATFSASGRQLAAELRAKGIEPSRASEARRKLGEKNSQHMREQAAWEADHGGDSDPELFRRDILPGLQHVSLAAMAKQTGLSRQHCSYIRRGIRIPHPRHWDKFKKIVSL